MNGSVDRRRPDGSEYDGYYDRYVRPVPDGDIIDLLSAQLAATRDLLNIIPIEKEAYRYAPGKWTTKEVVGHIIDTEWVFAYRGLNFARNFPIPLPGMDQDEFMAGANFAARPFSSLSLEYSCLRGAVIQLFGSFDESILNRTGIASGCRFTVRSILYIIAGHERHHIEVLKDRYLRE